MQSRRRARSRKDSAAQDRISPPKTASTYLETETAATSDATMQFHSCVYIGSKQRQAMTRLDNYTTAPKPKAAAL